MSNSGDKSSTDQSMSLMTQHKLKSFQSILCLPNSKVQSPPEEYKSCFTIQEIPHPL